MDLGSFSNTFLKQDNPWHPEKFSSPKVAAPQQ